MHLLGHNVSLTNEREKGNPIAVYSTCLTPFCRLILVTCHIFSGSEGLAGKIQIASTIRTPWIRFGIPVYFIHSQGHTCLICIFKLIPLEIILSGQHSENGEIVLSFLFC